MHSEHMVFILGAVPENFIYIVMFLIPLAIISLVWLFEYGNRITAGLFWRIFLVISILFLVFLLRSSPKIPRFVGDIILITIMAAGLVHCFFFLVVRISENRYKAKVLLNLKPNPFRIVMMAAALFIFISKGVELFKDFGITASVYNEPNSNLSDVMSSLFMLVLSLYIIATSILGHQITEKGILSSGGLIRWKDIESYRWAGPKGLTLFFKAAGWFFINESFLKIAPEQKEHVDSIISEKLYSNNFQSGS